MIRLTGFVNLKPLKEEEKKKPVNEASEIKFEQLKPVEQKQIQAFEKVLRGKHAQIFDGIHGKVVFIKVSGGRGSHRFEAEEMKKLLALKVRWVEGNGDTISVAF